jgi:methyltransferase (TIGR00027 family)
MVLAAVEQNEDAAQRLVQDDLASAFLPRGMRAMVSATRWAPARRVMIGLTERFGPGLWANLACRKRFIDEKLDKSVHQIDAVVILGAGLDTRAYHLAHRSDVPVFEVDLPVNIERKRNVVRRALGGAPRSIHLVPIDFERDDLAVVLGKHGYRSDYRTFFVWEGVTQYLTEDAVRDTFGFMQNAAAGSQLVFTYIQRDFIDGTNLYGSRSTYRRFREKQQIWLFGIKPGDVAAFVAEYGWRLIEQAGPEYYLEHYIRPAGRNLAASQLEWTAYAEKVAEMTHG